LAALDIPPEVLPASSFPPGSAYVDHSPRLLLPGLDPAERGRLEVCACQQAELVEKHCRLYPAVIDQQALLAARVEAALVRNHPKPARVDDTMSTACIELSVRADE
ncbi:MAG: hypothetical protein B7X93_13180, partial [Hydrogenophilales bacterium 17-61-9]